MLDGTDIVYVARVPTRRIMTVAITIGTRFPAYATSMGRVLLADLPAPSTRGVPRWLWRRPLTSHTITAPEALRAELDRVREQGWAIVDQELEVGLRSLAAPVHRRGEVVAAINVSTAAGQADVAATRERLLPALLSAARAISDDLSHY